MPRDGKNYQEGGGSGASDEDSDRRVAGWFSVFAYIANNKYSCYVLLLMMLLYLTNQLHVFSLVATNSAMAAELQYGRRECQPSPHAHNRHPHSTTPTSLQPQHRSSEEGSWGAALINVTSPLSASHYDNDDNITLYCRDNTHICDLHQQPAHNSSTEEGDPPLCVWVYTGLGVQYQLLAGPLFIVLFSISGIPMGLMAELNNINRKYLLVLCALSWTLMTLLGGFAHAYWHVALSRLLLGIFSAGCVPFCASIISDYFSPSERGVALGFYTCGIYVGYSFTFLLLMVESSMGWRSVYYIASAPGFLLVLVLCVTVKEPKRRGAEAQKVLTVVKSQLAKLRIALGLFLDPALLTLCFAGALRNGAGIVWAYNVAIFFDTYHPDVHLERWMSWIPLVFGCVGAVSGGAISDSVSTRRGLRGRLIVLIVSLLCSVPFSALILYLPMPWAMVAHMFYYLAGEMWIGVCITIVVELVPSDVTASAIAVFFFIIQILGGNMPLLVPLLNKAMSSTRGSLLLLFPGGIVAGVVLFTLSLCCINQTANGKNSHMVESKDVCLDATAEEDQKRDASL